MAEQRQARPKNVVVVDAENPLVEVRGEFFWREDHEVIVAAARDDAYAAGYRQGWGDAAGSVSPPQEFVVRYQAPLLVRVRRWVLAAVAAVGSLILLAATLESASRSW